HEAVFLVGDAATLAQNGRPLPGVAQVAIQEGRYVGRFIDAQIRTGRTPTRPFRYFDKGNMAVVGKNFAVLETRRLRLSGFTSWFVWAFVHLLFLPPLQNRMRVETQWLWSYISGQRSSRLIPEVRSGREETIGALSRMMRSRRRRPSQPPRVVFAAKTTVIVKSKPSVPVAFQSQAKRATLARSREFRLCAGFRPPALTKPPHARAAGV